MYLAKIKEYCLNRIEKSYGNAQNYISRFDDEYSDLKTLAKIGNDRAQSLWILKEKNNIPAVTNRCGSLILFLLNLSSIDPVASNIPLVRDVNYTDSVPDIDSDLSPIARDWVKKHIVEIFGSSKVCSIGTYQTYRTRAVIVDVARVLGHNVAEAMAVTKRIEPLKTFEDEEGEEHKVDQIGFDELCEHYPELKEYFDTYPDVRQHAEILRNQVKNMGMHAGGMIISDLDLRDRIPVLYDKPSSENRQVISAWAESGSAQELSSVGLVKYDLLGLCLEENTLISTNKGDVKIKDVAGLEIEYVDDKGEIQFCDDFLVTHTGEKDLIEITLEDGSQVVCSEYHLFFVVKNVLDICKVCEACKINIGDYVLTRNGYKKVVSVKSAGVGQCCDISLFKSEGLFHNEPNFVLSNGIISHNCNLPVISDCLKMIESTTGKHINRADIPINDRESILKGSKRDMVGIFQFENPVTKPIADAVGMESLNDVAAITSLIRPGPMDAEVNGVRMPLEYARRKHGGSYESPEFLRKALPETFSLLIYQENFMLISRVLSGFTASEANLLRKASGKKKADLMASIKSHFISGAQERIQKGEITLKEVEDIWGQIETFAGYGFNRSVDCDIPVWCNGVIQEVGKVKSGDSVICFDGSQLVETDVVANHDHGVLPAFEVEFEGGKKCVCIILHKFETKEGKVPLWKLMLDQGEVLYAEDYEQLGIRFLSGEFSDKCERDALEALDISSGRLLSARFVGFRHMCDLEVSHVSHNYVLANGIVTSNSHAVAYGAISTVEMWLKYHYPVQFIAALVNNTRSGKKKLGSDNILVDYLNYARRKEISVLGPDINKSGEEFRVENNGIRFALGHVRNVASAAKLIESFQPFTSLKDFYERVKIEIKEEIKVPSPVIPVDVPIPEDQDDEGEENGVIPTVEAFVTIEKTRTKRPNRRVVESLISAGAFDCFGTRNEMSKEYWKLRAKPSKLDRLRIKITEAEERANLAATSVVKSRLSGDEKDIKNALKELSKEQDRVVKAKANLEAEENFIKIASESIASESTEVIKVDRAAMPVDKTEGKWQDEETEMLGLCLSRPVLYKKYEEQIKKEGWSLISGIDPDKKKSLVFGELLKIEQHISKAGNSMHIAHLTDGIDTMKFFVFQGGWEMFKDNCQVGTLGAFPLAKFDEGDGGVRFFDDKRQIAIIKK